MLFTWAAIEVPEKKLKLHGVACFRLTSGLDVFPKIPRRKITRLNGGRARVPEATTFLQPSQDMSTYTKQHKLPGDLLNILHIAIRLLILNTFTLFP